MLYILLYIIISFICLGFGSQREYLKNGVIIFLLALLALFVGFADMLGGYDRYIYCELFDRNADLIRSGGPFLNPLSPLLGYSKETS